MKNKGWIIVLIILLPSLIWVLLDLSLINSKKLSYFGPKKLAENKKDTIYYTLKDVYFFNSSFQKEIIDTNTYKAFITVFIKPEYAAENFRITQFLSIAHFEPDKIKHIPIFLIYPFKEDSIIFNIKDSLKISLNNVYSRYLPYKEFTNMNMKFFLQKPYYVDYSFAALIDKQRHIRGYYDLRYADELKRMIQEYNHLIVKEGYKETLQKNKIEQKR